jgi:hypothetical protein
MEWLLAILLGFAAGAATRRVFLGYADPRRGALAPREVALVAAASEALFPAGGPIPESGLDADVPGFVARYVAAVPPRMRLLMRLLFLLIEHATLVFPAPPPGGRRRFSSLSQAQRVASLDGWRRSPLFPRRLVFTSLRAMLSMGYFASPAVLRRLRLAPLDVETPVLQADLLYPPIGQPRSEIRWNGADLTPPSDGRPLDLAGPLHPAYREVRR